MIQLDKCCDDFTLDILKMINLINEDNSFYIYTILKKKSKDLNIDDINEIKSKVEINERMKNYNKIALKYKKMH